MKSIEALQRKIYRCELCPRLRNHCKKISEIRRKSYSEETYWGKPVSGFGDPQARIYILGLAPAAHGANRTGRIFTGDRSGEWLYRALFKQGFANQPESRNRQDGLELDKVFISCAVKCAPPDNKPNPQEIINCSNYLVEELSHFKNVQVIIALGNIALQSLWPHLKSTGPRPKFKHGNKIKLDDGKTLILSYHPSQQNTFTRRLTEPMFDQIFLEARQHLE